MERQLEGSQWQWWRQLERVVASARGGDAATAGSGTDEGASMRDPSQVRGAAARYPELCVLLMWPGGERDNGL